MLRRLLRRHVLRSTISNAVASRFYRTKGVLGKVKVKANEDGGTKKTKSISAKSLEKPPKNKELKILEKSSVKEPGSERHSDLESFLEYAKRLKLAETSTIYVGTHYEYTVSFSLQSLGFDLTRTGRASDYGSDLLSHWSVPSLPKPMEYSSNAKYTAKASRQQMYGNWKVHSQ